MKYAEQMTAQEIRDYWNTEGEAPPSMTSRQSLAAIKRDLVGGMPNPHHRGYTASVRALKPGESFTYPPLEIMNRVYSSLHYIRSNYGLQLEQKGRTVTRLS